MPFAATCVGLEITILSGVSQSRVSHDATYVWGFPRGSADKEPACNAGDLGSIPGLGRSPGEGKGYQLQYSGLGNSMDCVVRGVTKSRTRLSDFHFHMWKQKKRERDNKRTYLQNRNELTGIENKLMVTRGGGGIS